MSALVDLAPEQQATQSDYRALACMVRSAGLLDRRPGAYLMRMLAVVAGLLAAWGALFTIKGWWVVLAVAVFMAAIFVQVVFIGHDVGHQQVFRSRRANRLTGLVVGDVLTGLSFGWWVRKHNAHHTHPNQVDRDPDIGAGVIAFTAEIAQRRRGASRWLARHQAWLFFPLLTLEGLALHVASIRALAAQRDRHALLEGLLLSVHAFAYLGLIFWALPPLQALAFIAVQQAVFGLYLGCTFAPNHKGMLTIEHDSDESFLRRQVLTARNVKGGVVTTVLLGGLNYQIEHHLFPMMPRRNLAKAQHIVRDFCSAQGLAYEQCGLFASYRQALSHLQRVGQGTLAGPP